MQKQILKKKPNDTYAIFEDNDIALRQYYSYASFLLSISLL